MIWKKVKDGMNEWAGMITMLALVAGAFMHLANKIDALSNTMHQDFKEIHAEMADFRCQMARQDAEFKAHMVYYHHE